MTTQIDSTIKTALTRAEMLGTKHGRNAGEWAAQDTFGGRFTGDAESAAREFLRLAEDGDPILWDRYKAPDLSGEWADSMTPDLLVEHCFDTEFPTDWEDSADAVCNAYLDAASNGFWGRLEESAAAVLDH